MGAFIWPFIERLAKYIGENTHNPKAITEMFMMYAERHLTLKEIKEEAVA